ncbi:unnamed protein product (macronuclear) [Paramecium tetraurelia]|uniref:Folate/biopterin transporter n=1 Tax=Paramecium tetraurelia TaxID=5888 RepID=A0E800_PARTE|nr:uncharacterized protein GSPATT00024145001 [Paramecium tetraurelia]CAK91417.1 unnamed protein product [Paramecium tetraurelia]|eukprot:XP_001458814.1 hypothetical protein (macronuclear) [Paramecium tetraurelia strain d4-2]
MKKEEAMHQSLRFTYFLIGTIAFSQGIMGLSDLAISYMQKDDYKQDPAQTQFFSTIISLPWIVKPFWGIMTDTVPLFGYRRKSYLIFFGVLGFFCWNLLADYGVENREFGLILLTVINICVAFCNVIGEALLVEYSGHSDDDTHQNDKASQNVTFFFGMRSTGTLVTAYSSGKLLQLFDKRYIFKITSIFPLILAGIAVFVKEKKYSKDEPEKDKIKTVESLKLFSKFVSQPVIYRPILLIMVFMSSPSISTAMFYFYTNVLQFGPDFIGELRLSYSICSILSAYLFNRFLRHVKFTKVFGYSTFVYCLVSCQTTLLVTRKNVKLGIPDRLFCFGDGVLNQVIGELNTMPVLVLACKMCPKNIEGTMYALLMSAINFGGMVSQELGALLTYYAGVTDDNFDNLARLIVICSFCTMLPLPFLGIINEDQMAKAREKHQYESLPKEEDEINVEQEVEEITDTKCANLQNEQLLI